jgi:cytochrome c-type biogenesis protein
MIASVSFGAALFAGAISFVSPCVLPLVPPYLSFLAGSSIDALQSGDRAVKRRVILTALLFIAGFSTVFILLGATASWLGMVLRQYLEALTWFAGVAIILMGLHFLGVFQFALLYKQVRFTPQIKSSKTLGMGGAYLMGLAFAFGWTPCIGPVLGVILGLATTESNAAYGALLLGVYSLGLGIPFLLAAVLVRQFLAFSQKMRRHLPVIEKIMGAFLVLTGFAFLSGGMAAASFWLLETFPALGRLG